MMKKLMSCLALAGLLATTGCIDNSVLVALNRDGSGYVIETTYMSAAAMEMMSGMMEGEGGSVEMGGGYASHVQGGGL